ncbi:MAG: nitrogenase component 1 [Candidatus Gracilibacteria bacterium]|nr:nitrogenase component 1 [Candidatus Gracilibacteria bacterium]
MDLIEKYSQIYGSPFLTGIFMGVNALEDVALFVDGPDCVFYKADMIYKTHDLFSKLKDASIDTKIYFSGIMPNKIVRGYDDEIKRKLTFIEKNNNFTLGIVTCMPVTGLIANQYENIYCDMQKDFIFIPSKTDKFRLDGYGDLLKELAKYIKLDETKIKNKFGISIIGYLYDRNEGDCRGNIEEIKRLLNLIGVEINSIWLDGGKMIDLSKVELSSLIISFPYGKQATKILSKRMSIEYIDLEIPFGIKNTIKFIKQIGLKLGVDNKLIDEVIKSEFNEVKQKIDCLDSSKFIGKKFLYAGDTFLESGIIDIGNFLGMDHIKTYSYSGSKKAKESDHSKEEINLIICNGEFEIKSDYKIEFGFPSYNKHYLVNTPYMGFKGILNFVEGIYNEFNKDNLYYL